MPTCTFSSFLTSENILLIFGAKSSISNLAGSIIDFFNEVAKLIDNSDSFLRSFLNLLKPKLFFYR